MFSLVVIFLSFTGLLSVQPVHNPVFNDVQPIPFGLVVQASPVSSQFLQPTYDPQQ